MFELYLDSADLERIARFNECLPLAGITTNPSILAAAGIGVNQFLSEASKILGDNARFHVQVVSADIDGMLAEARKLHDLPYDIVVKVPTTETGLAAMKRIKTDNIPFLATAIYSVQQGFLAALCGADYLAPYVNRIDNLGMDGIGVVADLQSLLERQGMTSKILAASFKSTRQALAIMQCGAAAVTLPLDVAERMLSHPAVQPAVDCFGADWRAAFGDKLSHES
ncbi:transaldolase family protein [Methylomarinum vadi]|uniref:transaldolase family protein n=1 Tax=Methylomarinum vadi TaxID=438855 RepID=UPI0004DF661D|nr:transaldolase family protein [Methylomarinum vadi]